jgi:hypothetical protein
MPHAKDAKAQNSSEGLPHDGRAFPLRQRCGWSVGHSRGPPTIAFTLKVSGGGGCKGAPKRGGIIRWGRALLADRGCVRRTSRSTGELETDALAGSARAWWIVPHARIQQAVVFNRRKQSKQRKQRFAKPEIASAKEAKALFLPKGALGLSNSFPPNERAAAGPLDTVH